MFSTTSLVILLACISIFALRSYKKGLWKVILGFAGFACAYLVSFIVAPFLGGLALSNGASGIAAFLVAMGAIFFVISSLVSSVPVYMYPSLKDVSILQRLMGAVLGSMTGVFFAIILIWLVSAMSSVVGLKPKSEDGMPVVPDFLSRTSTKIVSTLVHAGVSLVEKDEYKASVTAAFITAPHVFSEAFTEVSKSSELKDFWADGKSQFLMGEGDVDQLMQEPAFNAFAHSSGVQKLLLEGKPKDVSAEDAERYLATQMSFVWRRMRDLRGDERVAEILADTEVKDLIAKQNPMLLLSNKKIQSLIGIVMETPLGESIEPPNIEIVKAPPLVKRVIYKWRADSGEMRYTDLKNTPEDKRGLAEKIMH